MMIGIIANTKAAIASSHCFENAPKKLFIANGIVLIFPLTVKNGNKKSFHIQILFNTATVTVVGFNNGNTILV